MLSELREPFLTYLNGPGFVRLWPSVKEKLERLDRVGGRVTLSGLNLAERQAIEGLLAVNLHGQDHCKIDLKQLDTLLSKSRFEATLEETMDLLYPGAFVSRRAERESEQARWAEFCDWAVTLADSPQLKNWVDALASQNSAVVGYRTFRECYDEFCQAQESASFGHAASAMNLVLAGKTMCALRLPVFAAMATGDPHGLDRNTLAGRMFFRALVAMSELVRMSEQDMLDETSDWTALEASDGEMVRGLYARFGILLDDVSSHVFVAGLPGVAELPIAMTLLAVNQLVIRSQPEQVYPERVYVVENPSVFGTLADTVAGPDGRTSESRRLPYPYPLICTSGQPSVAALRLLDKLTAAGSTIYYSGDFDLAGLQMAVALAQRYGERFRAWRMGAKDYLGVRHADLLKFSGAELVRMRDMHLPWEKGVPAQASLLRALTLRRVKVFQEHLIEQLKEDYL